MQVNITKDQAIFYLKIAAVIVAIILVFMFFKKGFDTVKNFFGFGEDAKDENPDFSPDEYLEGLMISDDFNLQSYVAELHDAITVNRTFTASIRCKAYERYHEELNDNEFIAVSNAYYGTYDRTLRSDINETIVNGCSIFSTSWEDKVLSRMNKLSIT